MSEDTIDPIRQWETVPRRLDEPYPHAPWREAFTRFWRKGLTFSGRATRSEFWKAVALNIAIPAIIIAVIVPILGGRFWVVYTVVATLWMLAVIVPTLALWVRRLHDGNFSGWLLLLGLIPGLGGIALVVFALLPSQQAGARFDADPTSVAAGPAAPAGEPPVAAPAAYATPLAPGAVPTFTQIVRASPQPPAATPVVPLEPAVAPATPPAEFVSPAMAAPMPTMAPEAPHVAVPPPGMPSAPPASGIPAMGLPTLPGDVMPSVSPPSDVTAPFTAVMPMVWAVELADGIRMEIGQGLVFGRNPVAVEPGDRLVVVDPSNKYVTKTHARIFVRTGTPYVADLHSTNGTRVTTVNGEVLNVLPEIDHALAVGDRVILGNYEVVILAGAGTV